MDDDAGLRVIDGGSQLWMADWTPGGSPLDSHSNKQAARSLSGALSLSLAPSLSLSSGRVTSHSLSHTSQPKRRSLMADGQRCSGRSVAPCLVVTLVGRWAHKPTLLQPLCQSRRALDVDGS
jgi:hypothetical protein